MCGRYVIVSKVKEIETKFNATAEFSIEPNYNVSAGAKVPVITNEHPSKIQALHFGFSPSFAAKKMYVINARAEGDHNKENHPDFNGAKGIIKKPFFRKAIRSQRCLVIADAFIEGTTTKKLDEPHLVYLSNQQKPFAFAGIYDHWLEPTTGHTYSSFAVITCPPNELMGKLPHHRMPVILNPSDYSTYLAGDTPLAEVTSLLQPYSAKLMNAFKISNEIKNPKNNRKSLLEPVSEWIRKEKTIVAEQQLKLFGMGESASKDQREKS